MAKAKKAPPKKAAAKKRAPAVPLDHAKAKVGRALDKARGG